MIFNNSQFSKFFLRKYDFGKLAFENSGGIGIECPVCHKFGQVITPKDVEAAELILFDYLNKHRILHRFLSGT